MASSFTASTPLAGIRIATWCLSIHFFLSKLMHFCTKLRLLIGLSTNRLSERRFPSHSVSSRETSRWAHRLGSHHHCCHPSCPYHTSRLQQGQNGKGQAEVACRASKRRHRIRNTGMRQGRARKQRGPGDPSRSRDTQHEELNCIPAKTQALSTPNTSECDPIWTQSLYGDKLK